MRHLYFVFRPSLGYKSSFLVRAVSLPLECHCLIDTGQLLGALGVSLACLVCVGLDWQRLVVKAVLWTWFPICWHGREHPHCWLIETAVVTKTPMSSLQLTVAEVETVRWSSVPFTLHIKANANCCHVVLLMSEGLIQSKFVAHPCIRTDIVAPI